MQRESQAIQTRRPAAGVLSEKERAALERYRRATNYLTAAQNTCAKIVVGGAVAAGAHKNGYRPLGDRAGIMQLSAFAR